MGVCGAGGNAMNWESTKQQFFAAFLTTSDKNFPVLGLLRNLGQEWRERVKLLLFSGITVGCLSLRLHCR